MNLILTKVFSILNSIEKVSILINIMNSSNKILTKLNKD